MKHERLISLIFLDQNEISKKHFQISNKLTKKNQTTDHLAQKVQYTIEHCSKGEEGGGVEPVLRYFGAKFEVF